MRPVVATLRRFDPRSWELWLVPLLAAVSGAAIMGTTGGDLALLRGLVFVGGPLLLLAGLHPRLDGYLHARARDRLLPLPLRPDEHWAAAGGPHRRGLQWTGTVGALALGGASVSRGLPAPGAVGLLGDWVWLWLIAFAVEPLIPAVGAWLGRRFPADRPERRLQLALGGGWTIPEAVVHLYAPALGVGIIALLAMPGQLWLDRRVDGIDSPPALAITAGLGLGLAIGLGRLARRLYARGFFGAVPWVHEAIRTLAGPPVPDPVPSWFRLGRDPIQRLVLQQVWRTTPVPGVRLVALVGGTLWLGLAAQPSVTGASLTAALAATWVIPCVSIVVSERGRARICAALPVPPSARAGRSRSAAAIVAAPVVFAIVVLLATWTYGG